MYEGGEAFSQLMLSDPATDSVIVSVIDPTTDSGSKN